MYIAPSTVGLTRLNTCCAGSTRGKTLKTNFPNHKWRIRIYIYIYIEGVFEKTSGNIKIKELLDCFEGNELKWKKKGLKGYQFLKYLTETKRDLMKSSMIASVRKRCRLGDPWWSMIKMQMNQWTGLLRKLEERESYLLKRQ